MASPRRRFQVIVLENEWSVEAEIRCAIRVGSEWVWDEDFPGLSLMPSSETDAKAVLKDALIALVEQL